MKIGDEKDIIYIVGNTSNSDLKELWFVYGDCCAANSDIYENTKNKVIAGINSIEDIELTKTNELGRVKRVDPLGITDLRIRGMWTMHHPKKVFAYLPKQNISSYFQFYCVIKTEKFEQFPKKDKNGLYSLVNYKNFFIHDVHIKNPNNPADLIQAKFMEFYYG